MKKNKGKLKDIDELTDIVIGKRGTPNREKFEYELRMDIMGTMIREARKRKHLSQEQLGALIGVQKAQVSKIENNTKNFRLETILRAMNALGMKVKLSVEYDNQENLILS
jgi:HTH-type transcriptional regulator / antitoxin HipB